jgi:predicted  nucleic acid-binding Zn-ribbon protein
MEAEKLHFNGKDYEVDDFNDRAKSLYREIQELSPQVEEAEKQFNKAQQEYGALSNAFQWLLKQLTKELGIINDNQDDNDTEASGS